MKFIQQNQTNQQTEQISLNYFEFLSFSVVILNFSKLMGPKTLSQFLYICFYHLLEMLI